MKLEIFTIFDTKVLSFSMPFFAANLGTAIRTVQDVMASGDSNLSRHPNDYVLYGVGYFDNTTGELHGKRAENLGVVASFVPPPPAVGSLFKEGK